MGEGGWVVGRAKEWPGSWRRITELWAFENDPGSVVLSPILILTCALG